MLFDIGLSNIFLDLSPQAGETKARINKWNRIKLKSICTVKEIATKTKWQPTEWEKIFANNMSDKGNYPKYIKNSYNSISKKQMLTGPLPVKKIGLFVFWILSCMSF